MPPALLDTGCDVGRMIDLLTHLHVGENEIALYGFSSLEELELFELLLGVTGIGPRTALAIVSTFAPETLRAVLAQGDPLALTRIPGVGRKMAQRLFVELKEKVGLTGRAATNAPSPADVEVISALTALGYSLAEAQSAVAALPPEAKSLDERILAALRFFGSS